MLSQLRTLLSLKGRERGFTLIELLIVVLIVGILAAVGVPLYFGYINDAKSVEGKSVAGALWTTIQANSIAACGSSTLLADAYSKTGLDSSGKTPDGRWVASGTATIPSIPCDSGKFPDGDVFTLKGQKTDITKIWVKLNYTIAKEPASQLLCSFSAADPTTKC